jgi:hypothetical protein
MARETDRGVEISATVTTPDRGVLTLPLPTPCRAFNTRDALLDLVMVASCLEDPLAEARRRGDDEPIFESTCNPEAVTGPTLALVKWPESPDLIS